MKRLIVLIIFISLILTGCAENITKDYRETKEESDEITVKTQENRIRIVTDLMSGCQYIVFDWNGSAITPRMGKDGKQICE